MAHFSHYAIVALLVAVPSAEGAGNIIGGGCCAPTYNESHDYFPDKVMVDYQTGFTVEYHPNFKLVSIESTGEEYVLFQRGTPQPSVSALMAGKPDLQFIPIPIERAAVLSNSYFAYFELLGERKSIVATTQHQYINEPCLTRMVIEDGMLDGVTSRDLQNNNVFQENNADVVFRWSGSRDASLQQDLTMPVVRVDTGSETKPIMMMEWIKYVSLFYNRELEATRLVNEMKIRYDCIVSHVAHQPEVKVLFASFSYSSSANEVRCSFSIRPWQEHMIKDLGGTVIGAYPGYAGSSQPCDMAAFRAHANTADVWLYRANNFQEGRYGSTWSVMWNISSEITSITPYVNGRTFDPNGNHFRDFWASRMVELDVELEDLAVILHPEMGYSHQRVWWLNVSTETDPGLPRAEECTCKYGPQVLRADACPGNPNTAPQPNPKPNSDYGCNGELAATVCDAQPMAIRCGTEPPSSTPKITTTQAGQLAPLVVEESEDDKSLALGVGLGLAVPLLIALAVLVFFMAKCEWKQSNRPHRLQEGTAAVAAVAPSQDGTVIGASPEQA